MANAVTLFDPGAVPAHIAEAMADGESNIITRSGVNQLTWLGKVWSMTLDGTKKPLMKRTEDGDEEPVAIFTGVILAYPERRARTYYPGVFNQEQIKIPDCWSNDGITSAENAPNRQATKCNQCKMSAKGSKQTDDGRASTACSEHLMVALIPASRIGEFPPMRAKLPITSIWDAKNKDMQATGWYAFSQYMDFLKSKGVNKTYMLTTRMKFDPTVAYPKLLFSPGKWLTAEQLEAVRGIVADPSIEGLLTTEFTPNASDAAFMTDDPEDEVAVPVSAKPAPKPAPKPADDDPDDAEPAPAPAPTPPKPAPAPVVAPSDDEPEEIVVKPQAKPQPKSKAAPVLAPVDDEVEEVVVAPAPTAVSAPPANPKAAAAAKAAAARKAAPPIIDPDEDDPVPAAPAPKAAKAGAKPASATPPVAASAAVNSVLEEWDD